MQKGRGRPEVIASSGTSSTILVLPTRKRNRRGSTRRRDQPDNSGSETLQLAAARRLNVNQTKVSALSNYQLEGFSVERLMNFLTALDRDVDIIIRRAPRSRKGAVS